MRVKLSGEWGSIRIQKVYKWGQGRMASSGKSRIGREHEGDSTAEPITGGGKQKKKTGEQGVK